VKNSSGNLLKPLKPALIAEQNKIRNEIRKEFNTNPETVLSKLLSRENSISNTPRITRIDSEQYAKEGIKHLEKHLGPEDAFIMNKYLSEKIKREKPKDKKKFIQKLLDEVTKNPKTTAENKTKIQRQSTRFLKNTFPNISKAVDFNLPMKKQIQALAKLTEFKNLNKDDQKQAIRALSNYSPEISEKLQKRTNSTKNFITRLGSVSSNKPNADFNQIANMEEQIKNIVGQKNIENTIKKEQLGKLLKNVSFTDPNLKNNTIKYFADSTPEEIRGIYGSF